MRWIIGGAAIVAVFFTITLRVFDAVWPLEAPRRPPAEVATTPLLAMSRTSFVIAPIAVANTAIRDAIEAAAPRQFTGKRENMLPELLSKAELDWTMNRGTVGIASRSNTLTVTTALNGTVRLLGQAGGQVGNITRSIAGFAGADAGQAVQGAVGKPFEQRAEMRGNIAVLARPVLTSAWRLEPNLTSKVGVVDVSLAVSGVTVSLGKDVRPMVERAVTAELATYANRIRGDDAIEKAARRQWASLCRSIPLKSQAPGIPDLWLEMRPVRALAAQPRIGADALNLALGVQAETRILTHETQPDCPFPAELEILPPPERGRIAIALAIDLPFVEVNRVLEQRLVGKSFPDDGSMAATIEGASLAGAGDRLLLALRLRAGRKGWFGLSASADVFMWGRAALDRDNQIVRLADLAVDVQSDAALGLLGAAVRAAMPYLQSMLAEKAVVDLKPFAASARASVEAAVDAFSRPQPGVRVFTGISALRLTGVEFDASTLRLVAELDGALSVEVSALPK